MIKPDVVIALPISPSVCLKIQFIRIAPGKNIGYRIGNKIAFSRALISARTLPGHSSASSISSFIESTDKIHRCSTTPTYLTYHLYEAADLPRRVRGYRKLTKMSPKVPVLQRRFQETSLNPLQLHRAL